VIAVNSEAGPVLIGEFLAAEILRLEDEIHR
jgi:hypothetical protein